MYCIMCDQLFHVSGVTAIGYAAFFDTKLTSVTIPGYDIHIYLIYARSCVCLFIMRCLSYVWLLIAMYIWYYAIQDGVDHWR